MTAATRAAQEEGRRAFLTALAVVAAFLPFTVLVII
jgi:hypothetical protein